MKKGVLLPKAVEKRVNLFFRPLCISERRALPDAPFFFVSAVSVACLFGASEAKFYFIIHALLFHLYIFFRPAHERYG